MVKLSPKPFLTPNTQAVLGVLSLFLIAGCVSSPTVSNEQLESEQKKALETSEEQNTYKPFHIIQDIQNLSLHCNWETPMNVEQWRSNLNASWVTNAGYFDEAFAPTGFVKTSSQESFGDFYNYPVFVGEHSEGSIIIDSPEGYDPEDFEWALTSYPQLVKNGQSGFPTETNKKANRTIIAQTQNRTDLILFFDFPTLHESANRLINTGYENAINLDGGPSTGLASDTFNHPSSRVGCVVAGE